MKMAGIFPVIFFAAGRVSLRRLPRQEPAAAKTAGPAKQRSADFFTIFIDAIFTSLFEPLFTKVFDVIGASQRILACIPRAPPINSPAT
jgi:hypothetical protein